MTIRTELVIVIAGLSPATALADAPGEYYGHHMWGDGWGWSMMGGSVMALFWIAVIVAVVFAVRAFADRDRTGGRSGDSALEILRERFARGEIDQAEFDERRKALGD
jgi:putative membrane protein